MHEDLGVGKGFVSLLCKVKYCIRPEDEDLGYLDTDT
jgi:hypothetical protein